MKAMRTLLAIFLVLIITGGLGYLGYTTLFMGGMNHANTNISAGNTAAPQGQSNDMAGMQDTNNSNNQQSTGVPNILAAQNKERLSQAQTLINQAMDLITIDPYSKATVPQQNNPAMQPGQMQPGQMQPGQMQPSQGSGTINIYPGGNSSVTIMPDGKDAAVNPAPSASVNNNAANNNVSENNYVYDQSQLRQLHNDIYTAAQGIMMINQLNDDLTMQSSFVETNPPNYQTYVARYNMALQNKTELNNAVGMLNSISTLININPYAPQDGYQFKSGEMDRLHEGVYKLAQAMVILNRLNNDFTLQMSNASVGASNLSNQANQTPHITSATTSVLSMPLIINIVLIVLIIGLIAGIIGAIMKMARRNNNPAPESGKVT